MRRGGVGRVGAAVLLAWALALAALVLAPALSIRGMAGAALPTGVNWWGVARLAGNSLLVSGLAGLLSAAWSLAPAIALSRLESPRWRAFLLAVAAMPLFVPPSVVAVAAIRLLGGRGLLSRALDAVVPGDPTLASAGWPAFVYTLPGLALVLAWSLWPVALLCILVAMENRDREAEDAALCETSPSGVLARLVVPAAMPSALLGGALVGFLAMLEFGAPEALRSQPVLVSQIYTQFGVYYDGASASRIALMLVGFSLGGLALLGRLLSSLREGGERAGTSLERMPAAAAPARMRRSLRPLRWLGRLLILLPSLGLLIILARSTAGPEGFWITLFHTTSRYGREFLFTMVFAGIVAIVSALVGALLGILLSHARRPVWGRFVLLAGFLLPGPIHGLGMKTILLHAQFPGEWMDDLVLRLDDSLAPLLVVQTLRFSPLVALLVEAQLRRLPGAWLDSARLDTGPLRAAWGAAGGLHFLGPPAFCGALLAFGLVLGEVGATVLLIPPGTTTLSVTLMTMMHYAPTSEVSALCLLMTTPALVVFSLILPVFGRILLGIQGQSVAQYPRRDLDKGTSL